MSDSKYPQTVTVENADQDIYTAVKDAQDQPWQINWPTGGDRFYGTKTEVKARMEKMAAEDNVALGVQPAF